MFDLREFWSLILSSCNSFWFLLMCVCVHVNSPGCLSAAMRKRKNARWDKWESFKSCEILTWRRKRWPLRPSPAFPLSSFRSFLFASLSHFHMWYSFSTGLVLPFFLLLLLFILLLLPLFFFFVFFFFLVPITFSAKKKLIGNAPRHSTCCTRVVLLVERLCRPCQRSIRLLQSIKTNNEPGKLFDASFKKNIIMLETDRLDWKV